MSRMGSEKDHLKKSAPRIGPALPSTSCVALQKSLHLSEFPGGRPQDLKGTSLLTAEDLKIT